VRKPVTLITGANGEIGQGLIEHFCDREANGILALDLEPMGERLQRCCAAAITGDILDEQLLQRLVSEYEIHEIYHLAALLSTRSEYTPDVAHRVNVDGTLNLLQLAHEQSRWHGRPVRFLFPSSIAAYGLPDLETKAQAGVVRTRDWNVPITMYGCNKLYCEQLGRYYAQHYRQLAADYTPSGVDFRAIRFPGIISATTMPSGGTSDYASEMIHAAARGKPYACFVSEGARIPFLAMPDAIKALLLLADAPRDRLRHVVYNVTGFSVTAGQIRERVLRAFPEAVITYEPDRARERIVDSWPADVDDSSARRDWGWTPDYGFERAFDEYLIPTIRG
jgi:threonine 3-dehydrogenase